jgi:hypothetical protein
MLSLFNAGKYTPLYLGLLAAVLWWAPEWGILLAAAALMARSEANMYLELLKKRELVAGTLTEWHCIRCDKLQRGYRRRDFVCNECREKPMVDTLGLTEKDHQAIEEAIRRSKQPRIEKGDQDIDPVADNWGQW